MFSTRAAGGSPRATLVEYPGRDVPVGQAPIDAPAQRDVVEREYVVHQLTSHARVSASHPALATACGRFCVAARNSVATATEVTNHNRLPLARASKGKALEKARETTRERKRSAERRRWGANRRLHRGVTRAAMAVNCANIGERAKKTQPIRVGFSGIGGAGGNRTRVRESSATSSTCVVTSLRSRCRYADAQAQPATSHLSFRP